LARELSSALSHKSRCFTHLSNSLTWRAITGEQPPTTPFTAKEYTQNGLPWFEYYDDAKALAGAPALKAMEGVASRGARKRERPLPENDSVMPASIVKLQRRLPADQVREGRDSTRRP
jgi:hypothetical protein